MNPATRTAAAAALLTMAALAAGGQDPAPATTPAPAPTPAPALAPAPAADSAALANLALFQSIELIRARERVAVRIEQAVDMLNQRFELKGNYYKDTGNRLRLQLNLEGTGSGGSKMLQVCDGRYLWEYQEVLGMKQYRRKEITPIFKRLEDPALDAVFRVQVTTAIGFAGPEALLVGFQGAVAFDQYAERDVDGVPSLVLGGKWKDRSGLLGPNDRPLAPTAQLPPYVPSNIQLFLDKATRWPYRVEMIGIKKTDMLEEDNREIDPVTKRPIGQKRPTPKVDPTSITLRYTLLPDSEIKPDEQFVFAAPAGVKPDDDTEVFLQMLDRAIAVKTEEKKQKEAAEGADAEARISLPAFDAPPTTPAPAPAPTTAPSPAPAAPR